MKIAIVTTHPIQYNSPVFKELARYGLEVKVFFTWEQSSEETFDKSFKRRIKWDIPLLEGFDYEFLVNVANDPGSHHFFGIDNPDGIKRIQDFSPDALLVYGWSFKSHLRIMWYFKKRIPIFFRGDSHVLDEGKGIKKIFRRIFLTKVYTHIDFAFYVGTNNKEYYLKHGLKEDQLIWAPHTVDNERFSNSGINKFEARLKKGLPSEGIYFIFIGKFEAKKNPLLLLQAFQELKENNVNLVFVGNGELEDRLKNNSSKNKNVFFLPFQNQREMPLIYSCADVVVLPSSYNETWGLVINEAMVCGKAVIASDKVGSAVDLIKTGRNGYVFYADNKKALVEKMNECIKNKSLLERMGLISKEIIQEWSIQRLVEAYCLGFQKTKK